MNANFQMVCSVFMALSQLKILCLRSFPGVCTFGCLGNSIKRNT